MVYLEQFRFPDEDTEFDWLSPPDGAGGRLVNYDTVGYYADVYPFRQTTSMGLMSLDFEPITILCGGNGSGKSTVLNVIARKLHADRSALYNNSHQFEAFVNLCQYTSSETLAGEETFGGHRSLQKYDIASITKVITSDDIFNWMQEHRLQNDRRMHKSYFVAEEYRNKNKGELPRHLNLETGYNVTEYKRGLAMRKMSFNQYMKSSVGKLERGFSNGETALMRLSETLENPGIYILDEPENSMSCEFQMRLADMIQYFARNNRCQFIIATHSPFLLAMQGAKVYNFDAEPVTVANWWETENVRLYFELFEQYRDKFLKTK